MNHHYHAHIHQPSKLYWIPSSTTWHHPPPSRREERRCWARRPGSGAPGWSWRIRARPSFHWVCFFGFGPGDGVDDVGWMFLIERTHRKLSWSVLFWSVEFEMSLMADFMQSTNWNRTQRVEITSFCGAWWRLTF